MGEKTLQRQKKSYKFPIRIKVSVWRIRIKVPICAISIKKDRQSKKKEKINLLPDRKYWDLIETNKMFY